MWAWLRWVGKLTKAATAVGRVAVQYGPGVVAAVIEAKTKRRDAGATEPPA